ncbi:MAG TPA: histidine phosphatase family protein [Verrucomicrobiae bacterium]|jgi:broad specificity phosphatase PhoE
MSSSKSLPPKVEPSQPTRLLLIRHAEVELRYQSVFGGRIDMKLSERGHVQAKKLAKFLRDKKFDAIYASPMKRVQQTFAPSRKHHPVKPIIFPDLREIDFGDWTGFGWDTVREKFGIQPYEWLDKIELGVVPNGESTVHFRTRVEPCLHKIIRKNRGKTVAIFCHGGVIRMMLAILLDLPLPKTAAFEIEYTSVTQIAMHPHLNEIELLNFTPWRDLIA